MKRKFEKVAEKIFSIEEKTVVNTVLFVSLLFSVVLVIHFIISML